jgi:hypothetical protein
MAAPTITWYPVTDNGGSPQKGSSISVLDFGNVQAGHWSDAKAIVATFSGNTANTLKFWLNDTVATGGNTNVSASAPSPWNHYYTIDDDWMDPDNVTDTMKAGGATDPNGNTWGVLPESEPGSSNFVNSSIASVPDDTDYIFLAVQPPSDAGDGVTENWGYRISYLFP